MNRTVRLQVAIAMLPSSCDGSRSPLSPSMILPAAVVGPADSRAPPRPASPSHALVVVAVGRRLARRTIPTFPREGGIHAITRRHRPAPHRPARARARRGPGGGDTAQGARADAQAVRHHEGRLREGDQSAGRADPAAGESPAARRGASTGPAPAGGGRPGPRRAGPWGRDQPHGPGAAARALLALQPARTRPAT